MRKLKDFSYPPTDAECDSWMNWLRKLHEKRQAERREEFDKIYSGELETEDSENEDFASSNPFEMPIEDVFKVGDKHVVTGRIKSGSVKVGDSLSLNGKNYNVLGVESFNKKLDQAYSGDNVGLLLDGFDVSDINLDDSLPPNDKIWHVKHIIDEDNYISTQSLKSSRDMSMMFKGLGVPSDFSSGTFYVETLRNPNLGYPVDYRKRLFGKVNATYRVDKPMIHYDHDKLLNEESDKAFKEYLAILDSATKSDKEIMLNGLTEEDLNVAINELAKRYPGKRFKIKVKYDK